jgi:translation initiation factor IF-1
MAGEMPGQTRKAAVEGVVVEILPSAGYRVELAARREQVVAHLAPTAERNFVRLRLRDRVLVELTAGDPRRGRIVKVIEQ